MFKVHGHDLTDAKGRHHLLWTGTGHPANRALLAGRLSDGAAHVDVVVAGGDLQHTHACLLQPQTEHAGKNTASEGGNHSLKQVSFQAYNPLLSSHALNPDVAYLWIFLDANRL